MKDMVAIKLMLVCAVALGMTVPAMAGAGAVLKPFVKSEVKHAVAAQTGKVVAKEAVKDGASAYASSALRRSLKTFVRPKVIMAGGVAGATMIAAGNVTSPEGGMGVRNVVRYGFIALPLVVVLVGGLYAAGFLRRAFKFAAGESGGCINRKGVRYAKDGAEYTRPAEGDGSGDTRLDPLAKRRG